MTRNDREFQSNFKRPYSVWIFFRVTYTIICDNFILNFIVKLVPRRFRSIKIKHLFVFLFLMAVFVQILVFGDLTYYKKLTTPTPSIAILHKPAIDKLDSNRTNINNSIVLKIPSEAEFRMNWIQNKLDRIAKYSERWEIKKILNNVTPLLKPSTRVHTFYYASYGNPETDGEWKLWNQEYVGNKNSGNSRLHPKGTHSPPIDIGSNYYPMLGCYSSRDSRIINTHLKQLRDAGIGLYPTSPTAYISARLDVSYLKEKHLLTGVVVVSWHPFESEHSIEDSLAIILDTAETYQLKVALHIEAYTGRNLENLFRNIHFITTNYASHPAFYRLMKNGKHLPVYYIYESYLMPVAMWRELLSSGGSQTVRGTPYDGLFIGLLLEMHHRYEIERSHFDGFYTFFSSNGYSYGSSWKNWKTLEDFAKKRKLLFFPSVSPGYIDTNIRPFNTALTRHRSHGQYYQVAWRSAIAARSYGVSIMSFNRWTDGSQIEPAQPKASPQFAYLDYEPEGPLFYLNLTRYWVKEFLSQSTDYKEL